MNIAIKIPPFSVRLFLRFLSFSRSSNFLIVCKGYGEDWENYTEVGWDEEKDLDVGLYKNYQIWLKKF